MPYGGGALTEVSYRLICLSNHTPLCFIPSPEQCASGGRHADGQMRSESHVEPCIGGACKAHFAMERVTVTRPGVGMWGFGLGWWAMPLISRPTGNPRTYTDENRRIGPVAYSKSAQQSTIGRNSGQARADTQSLKKQTSWELLSRDLRLVTQYWRSS